MHYSKWRADTVPRKSVPRPVAPLDQPDDPEAWIGRQAIWTAITRKNRVRILVKVIDAEFESDRKFGRINCVIEIPSTGDRATVSHKALRLVPQEVSQGKIPRGDRRSH